jgi:phosphoglycolate phosphatase/pyrophosphatase PpaX
MKTVLFDLDGTLGNMLPLCIAAFREAIEPLTGRPLTDDEINPARLSTRRLSGNPFQLLPVSTAGFGPSEEGTIGALLLENKARAVQRYFERYEALHSRWPEPFAGVPELLQYLKDRHVFLRTESLQ